MILIDNISHNITEDSFTFITNDGRVYIAKPMGTTDREDGKNPTVYRLISPTGADIGWYREAVLPVAILESKGTDHVVSLLNYDYRFNDKPMRLL